LKCETPSAFKCIDTLRANISINLLESHPGR
jgi:hypothetical protein